MSDIDIVGEITTANSKEVAYAKTNARIDNLITAVTVDSEVIDIRDGADGVRYSSAGNAVRTQFTSTKAQTESVKKAFSSVEPDVIAFFYDLSVGGYTASGTWNDTSAVYKKLRTYKEFIDLELFDKISIKMTGDTSNIKVSVFYYDSDYNLIGYDGSPTAWEHWYKLASEIKPNNSHADSTRYVKMMFSNYSGNNYYGFPDDCSITIIGHGFTNANTICVSATGDGDFYTITEAVKVANDSSGHPVNIFIKSGEYKESIRTTVSGVRNRYLNFIGENVNTVRWYMTTGQYSDAPLWTDAECHIENITFEMNDSEAPNDWTPGTSQSDRQNMLPGYALHIDGKVGTSDITTTSVKNCKCISNCNSACGCGNHMNQILLFENTYFEYTKQEKYDGIATEGGLCVHSAQNPQYMHDQYVVVKDCVSTGSGNVSATFNMSLNGGDDAVCSFINNSFWADGTGQNGVTYLKGSSTLKGISHGNNCENLNA